MPLECRSDIILHLLPTYFLTLQDCLKPSHPSSKTSPPFSFLWFLSQKTKTIKRMSPVLPASLTHSALPLFTLVVGSAMCVISHHLHKMSPPQCQPLLDTITLFLVTNHFLSHISILFHQFAKLLSSDSLPVHSFLPPCCKALNQFIFTASHPSPSSAWNPIPVTSLCHATLPFVKIASDWAGEMVSC